MKYVRILMGPYHGQTLQLDDDVADQAIADEWGADTSAEDYDRFNEPPAALGDASAYPPSLQGYLDSISGVQTEQPDEGGEKRARHSARGEPKAMPKATDDDDTNGEPAKSSAYSTGRSGRAKK